MRTTATVKPPDGVTWYYEQEGSGPHIVLIPEGPGDCHLYDRSMTLIAKHGFTVTTFDMPGMSRSADAPPDSYQNVTAHTLARYITGLLDALGIDTATFWGCSSGGAVALALAVDYPDRVRNALPHEVPTRIMDIVAVWMRLDDETLAKTVAEAMPKALVGDEEAWAALGDECHARLLKNYPRWLRGYGPLPQPWGVEELKGRPVDWSVGTLTPTGLFIDNVVTATKAGINVTLLPDMHFPYLTAPVEFAEYIARLTRKYL
jgi:pimeloyl-ACP methyl ester carboxylesterase